MGAVGTRPLLVILVVSARDIKQGSVWDAAADLREQSAAIVLVDGVIVEDYQAHVRLRKDALIRMSFTMLRDPPDRFGSGRDQFANLLVTG